MIKLNTFKLVLGVWKFFGFFLGQSWQKLGIFLSNLSVTLLSKFQCRPPSNPSSPDESIVEELEDDSLENSLENSLNVSDDSDNTE